MEYRRNKRRSAAPTGIYDDRKAMIVDIPKEKSEEYYRELEARVTELNNIVQRLGVSVKIEHGSLTIVYSQMEAAEKAGRFAGRPRKKEFTDEEIKEAILATDTREEAAELLEISRSTLQREIRARGLKF